MIVDTMVVSNLMTGTPDPAVLGWINDQPVRSLWLTSITIFEIELGIERLAQGRRQQQLSKAFIESVQEDFCGQVIDFHDAAAREAARFWARRERAGRPVGRQDAMIAGIALANGFSIATRNIKDFEGADITLIDPWTAEVR